VRLLSVDARGFGSDRAALAELIAGAGADVVCVHGGPHLLRWRSICAALARRAGLVVVTGGRTAGANLLLSTLGVDVTAVRDVRLPGGPAGAALAALRLRGADFVAVSATLSGNAAERVVQARELQTAIATLVPGNPPAIVSAEGSDRPGTAAWQVLVDERVGVGGRVFIDGRLNVADATEVPGPTPTTAVEITVELVTATP
jgi:hypothetical protein